ncbi:MAG: phage antirepressor KilAC domain-containing protein [Ruminococcus sp.]|nr:phage antirepressor KilAC domain-containing protein [Ruminococcus sp.]
MNENEVQVWNYEGAEVRIVQIDGEPWFVLTDVCRELDLANPTMVAKKLDNDERTKFDLGRQGETTIVNESGLYTVILRSDKPQAKPFRKWVTSVVLPSIRKHGAYMTDQALEKALTNPDFLIQLATQLKTEQEQRRRLETTVAAQSKQMEQDKPKVLFADSVAASSSSILIGELAKLIKQNGVDMGQRRLFAWMRENGYLIKRCGSEYNLPTQRSMERGLMEIKETSVIHSGYTTISKTPKVTGKGQVYFINLLVGQREAVTE